MPPLSTASDVADFRLGVLMLDTRFPRPVGDIGNPRTFPFEVIYRTVPRAMVSTIMTDDGLAPDLLDRFLTEAERLERDGADLITTGCGFLIRHQDDLATSVGVPVVASSLCLLPWLASRDHASIGVITYDARMLKPEEFAVDVPLVIEGIESGKELHPVIRDDRRTLDEAAARADVRDAAERLARRMTAPTAVVLECTNLAPYRDDIAAVVNCPVYDIRDPILWYAHFLAGDDTPWPELHDWLTGANFAVAPQEDAG